MRVHPTLIAILVLPLAACATPSTAPEEASFGPSPTLPAPDVSLVPTVHVAPVEPRPAGSHPTAPPGFTVTPFAANLQHPRWLYTLPNGDVLVAESNTPQPHDEGRGLVGWITKQFQKRAGAGVPSPWNAKRANESSRTRPPAMINRTPTARRKPKPRSGA